MLADCFGFLFMRSESSVTSRYERLLSHVKFHLNMLDVFSGSNCIAPGTLSRALQPVLRL